MIFFCFSSEKLKKSGLFFEEKYVSYITYIIRFYFLNANYILGLLYK